MASMVNPYEALHLYKSVCYTQINFLLLLTALQPHEIQTLQSQVVNALLQKIRLPVTFPRAIVFASTKSLGLGVPELDFHQGYSKI